MLEGQSSAPGPILLGQTRGKIRLKQYSLRSWQAYVNWIKRYILFHGKHHPINMGVNEAEAYLIHLAKPATPHTLHTLATHVLNKGGKGVQSPLDCL